MNQDSESNPPAQWGERTTRQAAKNYAERGWSVIPVPYRSKNPRRPGWSELRIGPESIPRYFRERMQNVGVLLGDPSGGLVDVDLDHPLAVELAPQFLPPTPAIFGRPGKVRSHWIYFATSAVAAMQFRSPSAGMLAEIRSTGQHTVFPPSTHESGEPIRWEVEDAEPAAVDPTRLIGAVVQLTDEVHRRLGENPSACESRIRSQTQAATAGGDGIKPDERDDQCLEVMLRLRIKDHKDGSHRLYCAACRAIERGLDEDAAVATIQEYARRRPFPKEWSLDEIRQRVRDAAQRVSQKIPPAIDDGSIPLGQRDPSSGRLVLSPQQTLPTAEAFIREFYTHADGRTLLCYADALMEWKDSCFRIVEDAAIRQQLQSWLHQALRYAGRASDREMELVDFPSNPLTVRAALESIRDATHVSTSFTPPCWLGLTPEGIAPYEVLVGHSKLLHLPTKQFYPATPRFFSTSALDFDPDVHAAVPTAWLQFLNQLFRDDEESVQLLQEWFGYCLTTDTSQQKMLLIIGPRRSGKGTIGRILRRLIGEANVAGPTTSSLAGPFGLQTLLGKLLAIVSDARFQGEHTSTVIERLLCMSGEDAITVDRKHQPSVTVKLPTRFLFLTNELPRLADSSGALASRFLILRLTESFYDREDPCLTDRLLGELPGILNWAIEGWNRLRQRGHFVAPVSTRGVFEDMEDLSSPVLAFLREVCVTGSGCRTDVGVLYSLWVDWCHRNGFPPATTIQTFGRDLMAAAPGVRRRRGHAQKSFYDGIGLKPVPDVKVGQ